ncbi:hypothetical protein CUC08_Gglean003807 [Alternaria sp. MG1]|nr:hypothetical protein CUC08_Gglean003807 [Alternaria sp. MG1]
MIPLIKRYPRYRKHMIYTGWPLTLLSLLASSYASTLPLLILIQGLFYGLGFTLFYYPILSMVNDFWIQRRGFAYGLSGCIIPFAMEAALNRWGYRITLRAAAGGLAVVTGPLLLFLRGRMESERSMSSTQPRTDWRFLNAGQFWIYSLSNLVQGLGYFFPGLYLPSYANSTGLSSRQGALLLAIMGTAQVAGQMSFGYLSDKKVSLNLLITVSTAMSSIAVLACWGMARQVYGYVGEDGNSGEQ